MRSQSSSLISWRRIGCTPVAKRRGNPRLSCSTPPGFVYTAYVAEIVGADFYHPSATALGIDGSTCRGLALPGPFANEEVARLRDRRIAVFVYTVNDVRPDGLAKRLAAVGVSGFFTDDPVGLRGLFPCASDRARRWPRGETK
jgi:hypothetical protein